jgi:hypothetical protein
LNKCGQSAQFALCVADGILGSLVYLYIMPLLYSVRFEDERRLNKCGQVAQYALCVADGILGSLVYLYIMPLLVLGTI